MKERYFVERTINRWFSKLGRSVGTHPKRYILGTFIVFLVLSLGLIRGRFNMKFIEITDPYDGRFHTERDYLEKMFPLNISHDFDISRATRLDRFGRIIVTVKDGTSLLNSEAFRDLIRLDQAVRNITVEWKGKSFNYEDICVKRNDKCFDNDVLYLSRHIEDFQRGVYKFKYPLTFDSRTLKIFYYNIFLGGVEMDENGYVKSCKAISLYYVPDFTSIADDAVHDKWEDSFIETVGNFESKEFNIYRFASESIIKELNYSVIKIIPFFVGSIIIAVGFAIFSNLKMDWVVSKPWLGIAAIVTAFMGIGSGFGICQMLNIPLFVLHIVIILMICGIALDDTFVILAAWRKTNVDDDVVDRIEETYRLSGIPITITSITNLLSFIIGIVTPFPIVRLFCAYCAVCILCCYIFTITFYGAILTLYGSLEKKKIHALTLYHNVIPKSMAVGKNKLFQLLCTGGRNPDDPDNPVDNQEHFFMVFFRDYFATFLLSKPGVILTLCTYFIYLGVGLYGVQSFKLRNREQDLVARDSYAFKYFIYQYKYFSEYQFRVQIAIDKPLDYSNLETQHKIKMMLQKYENFTMIDKNFFTESWLQTYTQFISSSKPYLWYRGFDCYSTDGFIRCLRDVFLKLPGYRRFSHDIAFNENQTEILASRFYIQSKSIPTADTALEMINSAFDTEKDSEIPIASFYNYLFIFGEHFLYLQKVAFTSVGVAVLVMIVISYLFIPKLKFMFFMGFTILSVEIGLLGYMTLIGWYLNTLTMIILIISVGFSVDNTAHVMCAFEESDKEDIHEKVKDALYYIGQPIVQGALSSLIGLIPMMSMDSDIFRGSASIMVLVIVFSAIHSLVFIPIMFYLLNIGWDFVFFKKTKTDKSALEPLKSTLLESKNNNIIIISQKS